MRPPEALVLSRNGGANLDIRCYRIMTRVLHSCESEIKCYNVVKDCIMEKINESYSVIN